MALEQALKNKSVLWRYIIDSREMGGIMLEVTRCKTTE